MSTDSADATRTQACCYVSTPEHVRSFVGRFIWIYTAKGSLRLNPEALVCELSNLVCEIPLLSIRRIGMVLYPGWPKPIKLKYIELTYLSQGEELTVLL